MSKTKLLNIRIEPELKKKAKKLAEADGRSLSNWVTNLIMTTVKDAEKEESSAEKADRSGKPKTAKEGKSGRKPEKAAEA